MEAIFSGKDVMAVLPTGSGKSIIYQSFVVAKNLAVSSPILVVSRLEVLSRTSNDLMTLPWKKKNQQLLMAIGAKKYHVFSLRVDLAHKAKI